MSTINTQELDARIAQKLCRPAKAQLCKKMLRFLMALILSLFVNSIAYALIQNLPTSFKVQKPLPVNQIQKATLIVGSEQDFPPFATGMSDESAGGFTVELWKAVASEAGLNYHIRVLPFHQLLDEFKSGKIDVLINLNVTDEAHVYADFSVPHSVFNGGIFVRNNESKIASEADLNGKSIIMMKDDVEANYATSRGWNNQLVFVETAAEGMQMLASGSHDAMLINKVVGLQTLQALKLDNIKALKAKAGFTQRFAFAVHTGQSELLGKINEGLAVTKANGVYNNLYDKWFGVYELKEIGVVDLLKYLMPIVLIFICILGYILYLRHRERKQAEESLEMMRFSVDNAHDSIFWINREGNILYVNLAACMEREYSLKEMLQMRIFDLDPDYQPGIWTLHFEELSRRGSISLETRHRTKNGRIFPVEVSANYINLNGKEFNFAVLRDITERKQAELALSISELSAKQSLAELKYQKSAVDEHAIVSVTDVQGIITYANSKFCKISGYTEEELLGQDHHILSSGYHPKGFFKEMYLTLATGKPWHDEICNRTKDGHLYWVDTTITPFMADDGKPKSYISIRTDITQRKAAEEKNNILALYDTLTNLANRRLLLDRLKQALASSARSSRRGALLFLDLDHFKKLNDTLGHDVGDTLLQAVASRLTSCIREGDTVARFGGDEFVVLLADLSEHAFEAAAQTKDIAEKMIITLNQPYQLKTNIYHNTASIGATLFVGHELEIDELLKQADIAMYQSKNEGRNTLCFFDPKMQEAIAARVDLENELRKAIQEQQFQLHYQIQVSSTGQAFGAEALIRWQHPERGMIPPYNFITLAEETGLILQIGQWVLDTACAQLKTWQQIPLTQNLLLAVNVSAKQFFQVDFVDQVKATLQKYDVNPTYLKLELTESMLVYNINDIITKMNALSKIGVIFSLDDFGTGYSSLQYLKMLPLSQLKIDQSFVRDIATDKSDAAIVRTIITMAHSLGIDVIAEGVETDEQKQFLLDNGCVQYQGYLFSRPVQIDEFDSLIRTKMQILKSA